MSEFSRRSFLSFVGTTAAASAAGGLFTQQAFAAPVPLNFTPVRVPFPLPIYVTNHNFLPTGVNGVGTLIASVETGGPAVELATYTVIDDVVVPPEYERYVISSWGDRPFINAHDYVGFNCDYTGYIPLSGTNDGLLWQNHEYTSYPFAPLVPETAAGLVGGVFDRVVSATSPTPYTLPTTKTRGFMGECLYNVGGSILRIKRVSRGGRFAVQNADAYNRRIHALSGLAINATRTDAYYTNARTTTQYAQVTGWGSLPHQVGDNNYLVGTGPAVADVFVGVNADTLGNKIIGTLGNCSGGNTPWGTVLSCEENFQADASAFYLGVTESVLPNGTQTGYVSSGTQTETGLRTAGAEFGLVGEKYGYVVEIDVKNPAVRAKKHTALGRYRHENVALRVEPGAKLAAYMGDDRRGGHVWKYVSNGVVSNVTSPSNSALFEDGVLYVAKFNANGTGSWIPLLLSTATNPNDPQDLSSVQFVQEGQRDRGGLVGLPRRNGIAGQSVDGGAFACTMANRALAITGGATGYQGKTLGNFYTSQGAVLVDAFLAANLVGGTPGARPEDIEVHPRTKEVFIAFTDGRAGSDGYADSRIFTVSKYTSAINAESQNGGLYKIVENGNLADALTFTWSKYVQSGEAGANNGLGFANLDNLAFDNKFNVWGVMDMSTELHNGFGLGPNPAVPAVPAFSHSVVGSGGGNAAGGTPGAGAQPFVGVFGNNWLFCIPTEGPDAGKQLPFAIGPMRAELTGPTFVGDHLILAVQHPGEGSPIDAQNTGPKTPVLELLNLAGTGVFNQTRTVPFGSSWPSNTVAGNTSGIPKPSVIGIRRKNGGAFI
jgi:secreted PhoX family phosphatase